MKLCVLICGEERCIDLVLENIQETFSDSRIDIITCLNIDPNNKNIQHPSIIQKLYLKDIHDNDYRNSLNYSYKISKGIKSISNQYDAYMIVRTDFIFNQKIDLEVLDNNKLYFAKKSINQFTHQELNKIPEGIIISKNYLQIQLLLGLYEFNRSHTNYLDLVLFQYLQLLEIDYELLNVDYKLILSQCNIIAIAGDSGSGKSSLIKVLELLFNNDHLVLETDRYHKWERGDSNYQKYTHLNPYANHLEKMYDDVYNLKIGNKIYQVDYDHSSGKFTPKQKIESKSNVMLCGLHTIYERKMNNLADLRIFIDTDRELVKKWKIQRDVYERGYSIEKVLKSIESRNQDYFDHILPQKENADIIINYYEENEDLKCKLLITKDLGCKIYKYLLNDYSMIFKDDYLVIQLDNIEIKDENVTKIFMEHQQFFQKNFLKEIFYILYMLLC